MSEKEQPRTLGDLLGKIHPEHIEAVREQSEENQYIVLNGEDTSLREKAHDLIEKHGEKFAPDLQGDLTLPTDTDSEASLHPSVDQ